MNHFAFVQICHILTSVKTLFDVQFWHKILMFFCGIFLTRKVKKILGFFNKMRKRKMRARKMETKIKSLRTTFQSIAPFSCQIVPVCNFTALKMVKISKYNLHVYYIIY